MIEQPKDTPMTQCSPLPADLCNNPRKDSDFSSVIYAAKNAMNVQPTSALQARRITILATPQDCIPDDATAEGYVRHRVSVSQRLFRVLEAPWLSELGDDEPPATGTPPALTKPIRRKTKRRLSRQQQTTKDNA